MLGDTQQIKAEQCGGDAEPNNFGDFLSDKYAEQRDNDDVQGGDKSRFARRCRGHAKLLQITGDTQHETAADAADEGHAVYVPLYFRRTALRFRLHAPLEQNNGNQNQSAEHGTNTHERKRLHMLHAGCLCDKRRSPNQSCEQQNKISGLFFYHRLPSFFETFLNSVPYFPPQYN